MGKNAGIIAIDALNLFGYDMIAGSIIQATTGYEIPLIPLLGTYKSFDDQSEAVDIS